MLLYCVQFVHRICIFDLIMNAAWTQLEIRKVVWLFGDICS